ncbi:fucose-1-phosphate guanylyltransferase [Hyalella azteca]|uniref:Fucose-1-phosphate guanylyltransferase n=1 Tax=Hyalella azteca TaxID=294128 RepID=A0A8B7PG62_HYAAZ|nr:fucose-1-phosphate guanylyltransferase [Hyalella azteca]
MELLQSSDVIALAHPSDVRTGEGHGVYVLDPRPSTTADVRVQSVLEVLQKPSRALMQAKGAIVKREISVGGPVEEMVYSDSVFWLSHRVYDALLSWYEDHTPLQEEFDAYAHLLPAFGDRIQDSKNENVRKHAESVSDFDKKVEGEKVDFEDDAKLTKRPRLVNDAGERSVQLCKTSHEFLVDMKNIMKNRSLKVIVLERSKFHHLGSMREYVDNLTSSRSLKQELRLQNIMKCNLKKFCNTDLVKNLVIMGCFVGDSVKCDIASDRRAVLEWSLIDVPIVIENDVLLSNCDTRLDPAVQILQTDIKIKIFENVVMHTVPIKVNNTIMYVTCVLNINDDIKFSTHELNKISYFGCDMSSVIRILDYDEKQVLANEKKISLWNLRLFPSATTANVSFWKSYSMINRLLNKTCGTTELTKVHYNTEKLYSLKDLSEAKDLDTLLNDRHKLLIKIGTNLQAML